MTTAFVVRCLVLALAITAAGLSVPTRVRASPLFELTGDVGATGALQARAVPGGTGAAYFNPALLIRTPAGATFGFMLVNQRIGVSIDGRPGPEFAVPPDLENAGHADFSRFDNYAIGTDLLQFGRAPTELDPEGFAARPRQAAGSGHKTLTYEVFGLNVKLFDDYVALGLHTVIPNGEFTRMGAFFNDEREQYFSNSLHPELYADRMTALSIALGMGVKITEELSLGAGATFGLKANVVAPTYVVDTGNLNDILIDLDAPVNVGVAPHFGVAWTLLDHLHLTATAHTPQQVELGTGFTFLLANAIQQASGVAFVLDYLPWRVGAGAAYDILHGSQHTFSVSASALYATWSSYVDRHGFKPSPAYAWSNTLSPTLGLRYGFDRFSTALDLTYVPTPVPLQTGRTNYVDNNRIGGDVGVAYQFELLDTALKLGAQFHAHRLQPRYQAKLPTPTRPDGQNAAPERVKDELPDDAQLSGDPIPEAAGLQTNNPGWPGFSSGGWVLAASVSLTVAL